MYRKLNNDELETIKRVSKITFADYEVKDDFIPVDSLLVAIEDLLIEIGRLEEKYNDFEQEVADNYKPYTKEEMYGVRNEDFY